MFKVFATGENPRSPIIFLLALPAPPIVEAIMAGKALRTRSLVNLDPHRPFFRREQLNLFGMA